MQQRPRRTVVLIAARHRPHEIGLLLVSAVTGAGLLAAPPPQVTHVFPGWQTPAWAWIVLTSSVVGLAGCLWRGRASTGLLVEGAGMLISAAAVAWYIVAALIRPDGSTAQAVATTAVWGAMNLWRAAQINADLRELR